MSTIWPSRKLPARVSVSSLSAGAMGSCALTAQQSQVLTAHSSSGPCDHLLSPDQINLELRSGPVRSSPCLGRTPTHVKTHGDSDCPLYPPAQEAKCQIAKKFTSDKLTPSDTTHVWASALSEGWGGRGLQGGVQAAVRGAEGPAPQASTKRGMDMRSSSWVAAPRLTSQVNRHV